ncbi:MAG TPA: gas vesicle protein [Myxococcales bacterium]|nr:gas vesicle protein [Myxococcales bacterium]
MGSELQLGGRQQASGLVDVLDRVLDKGLVIAGDIKVSLAEVELLTIRIRLIVCSIDKAQEIGLDWWRYDHHLAPGQNQLEMEKERLREQVRLLERKVEVLSRRTPGARRRTPAARNNGK